MSARFNSIGDIWNNTTKTTIQTGSPITSDPKLTQLTELMSAFSNGEINFSTLKARLASLDITVNGATTRASFTYRGKTYSVQQRTSAYSNTKFSSSTLRDIYKLTDEQINTYFTKKSETEYELNKSSGCKTISAVLAKVAQQYQNDMLLVNFLNDKNKTTNRITELRNTSDNKTINSYNYQDYIDEIQSSLGTDTDAAKKKALDKFITDFTQGNVAYSTVTSILKAIGVEYKLLSKGNNVGIQFTYDNKTYQLSCKLKAAIQGTDDKTVETYSADSLIQTGATQTLINKYFDSVTTVDGTAQTYALKSYVTYTQFLAEVEKSKVKNEASETTNSKESSLYSEKDLVAYKLSDSDIKIFFKKNDDGYTLNKDAVKSCFGKEINTVEELLDAMQNGSASIGYIYGAYSMGSDKYLQYFTVTGEGNNRKYTLNKDKIKKDFADLEITTFGQLKVLVDANATSTGGSQNATTTTTTTPTTPTTTNNTSASSKHFTNGLLRGAHGLDETIINDCFVKINQDTYIMNMGAIKSRFPNSNITTIDDLVSAYKNSEMVYTESELKYQFRANPDRVDFMFKKNEDGTYSLDKEKLAIGNLPTRDIGRLAELTDREIQIQFYEKSIQAYWKKETSIGSEIKKDMEYYAELYKRGIQGVVYTCDSETLNKAVDYALSELEISDNQQYSLSDMRSKFDSLLGDYITGRNKRSVNVNGEIDQAVAQGGAQDCWLIAGVLALNNTTNGKQILKNSISVNQDGSVTVKFAGVNAEYRISYEEMKLYDNEASFATKTVVAYSVGDNDLLAIELAVKKLKNDIDNGKVVLDVDANSYEGNRANTLDGGYAQQLLYFLTGNTSSTKTVDIPSNASDSTVKSTLSKGLTSSEVNAFLNSQNGSNSALTFSMYYSDKSAKCTDGSTFSVKLGDSGHTYAITNVDKNKRTVTFVDPSNSTKSYTMTWSEFAKMGIGMLSSTAVNSSKVEVTPKSRDFDADTIIAQLYTNSESASDKPTSQSNFTVELFDVDSDLYKVSLALIKNIYAGAEDLTKFRDILLQMAADTNFTPASFVKTLAEKLQSGDFEKAVDKQNQTKDLYTSIVSGYLSSLSADGAVNIGDFMQRLSNAGFSKDEMSPILDVFATTLYSMMLSQNAELSQQDFTTMLYSGSIKASDINKAIKKSVGTQTGVALNEALAKEVSNAATSVMSATVANAVASSVYASDISNIMGIVNGDKEYEGHITIEGKDYDMSGYAWNKLVEENHSDAKAIYDSLKNQASEPEIPDYNIETSNGVTIPTFLDDMNDDNGGTVSWVDNNGKQHEVKYKESEKDDQTSYTIYGENATIVIKETDDGYTVTIKDADGNKTVKNIGDNLEIEQLICGYAIDANYNGFNKDGLNANGYNRYGFNSDGINEVTGTKYDEKGFDADGNNIKTGTKFGEDGYNRDGFKENGIHRNGTKYDDKGYDANGFDKDGYDKDGFNKFGFDKNGCDKDGKKLTYQEMLALIINYSYKNAPSSMTTSSAPENKQVVSVLENNNNTPKDTTTASNPDVISTTPFYTKYDGKDVQTGEVVSYKDGRVFYYDVDPDTGKKTLAGVQGTDGVIVYLTPEGDPYAVKNASGKYMSFADYQASNPTTAADSAQMSESINNLQWSSLISALNAAGNTELANALDVWLKKGAQGSFSWKASGSSGSLGSSGGSSSGITNGGYCPDGTWSPVAGSGWGSVMDGVIGVGGHGGTPVLGGGGGYTNNSYH